MWPWDPGHGAGYCGSDGTEPDISRGYAYDHAWAVERARLTIEKLREPVLDGGAVTSQEFAQAVTALQDPNITVVPPPAAFTSMACALAHSRTWPGR